MTGVALLVRVGAWLAAAALVLFGVEVLHVLAHRRSRAPDLSVAHWHVVVAPSLVLAVAGMAYGLG